MIGLRAFGVGNAMRDADAARDRAGSIRAVPKAEEERRRVAMRALLESIVV